MQFAISRKNVIFEHIFFSKSTGIRQNLEIMNVVVYRIVANLQFDFLNLYVNIFNVLSKGF